MIEAADVILAYRSILGREPESDAVVIRNTRAFHSLADFVHTIVNSEEFSRLTYTQKARGFEAATKLVG